MKFPQTVSSAVVRGSLALLIMSLGVGCASSSSSSPPANVKTFDSADQAATALAQAVRSDDKATLRNILGDDADDILYSGDNVADKQRKEKFLSLYDAKHTLEQTDKDHVTLNIGEQDWPLPIPIVHASKTDKWYFDTDSGKEEILNRRIGQNELDVIEVCQAVVDAQKEYAQRDPDNNGIPEYARRFISVAGTRDGLYWPTKEGEQASPLGPLVADAVEEGYSAGSSEQPHPYHGYYYRMLSSQGPAATGGEQDYLVHDRMIGGFGVVAYPAEYGNSGIKTFIVNQDGVVYQKDLGDDTAKTAKAMKSFNPEKGWEKAEAKSAG